MKYLKECRCCGGNDLYRYLDLGDQPLANSYHKGVELENYPLQVDLCKSCYHSQLSVVIDPKIMFEHYLYVSGTSNTFRQHCKDFVMDALNAYNTSHGLLVMDCWVPPKVLDIACNDGTLLSCFRDQGCIVKGVDPSINLREITKDKNIPVEVGFWCDEIAEKIEKVDIITATNVFAHVDSVKDFLNSCKKALRTNGFVIIEFPYCKNMIAKGEFDTVYHEHLSYFLVNSFNALTSSCGFEIFNIIQTPIHGSSIRFFIRPGNNNCPAVAELIDLERKNGMLNVDTYNEFEKKIYNTKEEFCLEVKAQRRKVVGYGASAKGNTMLNFFNLKLDYIVDDNPLKWEYLTPGMDIPIVPTDTLREEKRDLAIVILSWNFAKEIIKRISFYRPHRDDVVMLYVPESNVLALPLLDDSLLSNISG